MKLFLHCRTPPGSFRDHAETLVAEWIDFTLFGIILPTIKLKVYTLGAYELSNEETPYP